MSPTLRLTVVLLGLAALLVILFRAAEEADKVRRSFPVTQIVAPMDTVAVWDSLTRRR